MFNEVVYIHAARLACVMRDMLRLSRILSQSHERACNAFQFPGKAAVTCLRLLRQDGPLNGPLSLQYRGPNDSDDDPSGTDR